MIRDNSIRKTRKEKVEEVKKIKVNDNELIDNLEGLIEYYIEAGYDFDEKSDSVKITGNPWLNDIVVFNQCIEIIKERMEKS